MPFNAGNTVLTFKRNAKAPENAKAQIFSAVQDIFEIDIKTDAKENSPVLTGTNKRSIDTEVVEVPAGVQATLFTQSGYGGYLELGTSRMAAQPYLFPAFEKFKSKIYTVIRQKLAGAL